MDGLRESLYRLGDGCGIALLCFNEFCEFVDGVILVIQFLLKETEHFTLIRDLFFQFLESLQMIVGSRIRCGGL